MTKWIAVVLVLVGCGTDDGASFEFQGGTGGVSTDEPAQPVAGANTTAGAIVAAVKTQPATGGSIATGGSVATGGASTGGAETGGMPATGGAVATGGVATGGAATGGTVGTGGQVSCQYEPVSRALRCNVGGRVDCSGVTVCSEETLGLRYCAGISSPGWADCQLCSQYTLDCDQNGANGCETPRDANNCAWCGDVCAAGKSCQSSRVEAGMMFCG